ncbi:MAG: TonB-dependent receptor [Desulfobulbaceae bacterium]|nr:TonB-dependent receptor [Desulfobulbaceae bacterium]
MALNSIFRFSLVGLVFPVFLSTAQSESLILEEITVRGERQQPFEENLTIREVRESPARDIGEALQNVPGLNMVRKGAIANDIVLRGFQRDNLNVFLDGTRLHGGCPSRMDPPSFHFDFAEVESVNIIKGPYDLANPGSLTGMVNAISKSPKPGPSTDLNLSYGSYDYLDASATASYGGEKFDGLIGYARKSSDVPESGDGKLLTDIYPSTSRNRYRADRIDSQAYKTDTFWLKGGSKIGEEGRSEISYSYQDADPVLYPALLMDADYDRTHRLNWMSTFEDVTPAISNVLFQVYYNQVDHVMDDTQRVSSLPSMMVTRDYSMLTDADTTTFGSKLNGELPMGPGSLTTGIDFYHRNWDATNEAVFQNYTPQPMIPDVDMNNFGAFAEYSWPLANSLTLKGGGRFDYTKVEANDLSDARLANLYQPYFSSNLDTDTDFSEPSANLQLTWQATDALEIFTGVASVSRPPDQQELYIGLQRGGTARNWLGNPSLDAPRNNQIDLGAKWKGSKIFASASVFYSSVSDYIYITDAPPPNATLIKARTYENVDARLWGAEFGSQIALPYDLFAKGTLSYVRGENTDTDLPLAEMPPLSGSVSLRYDNGEYFTELIERFAAKQDRVDTSLDEDETAGWGVTDIKAGTNWKNWELIAGINNLFDKNYFNHLSYQRDPFRSGEKVPEIGQFFYMNLSYRF